MFVFTSRIIIQKVLHWKDLKSTWKELLTKTAAVLEMLISCSIKRFGWNEAIEWQLSIDLKSRWPEITQNGMTMCNLTDDSLDQSFENLFFCRHLWLYFSIEPKKVSLEALVTIVTMLRDFL